MIYLLNLRNIYLWYKLKSTLLNFATDGLVHIGKFIWWVINGRTCLISKTNSNLQRSQPRFSLPIYLESFTPTFWLGTPSQRVIDIPLRDSYFFPTDISGMSIFWIIHKIYQRSAPFIYLFFFLRMQGILNPLKTWLPGNSHQAQYPSGTCLWITRGSGDAMVLG